MGNESFRLMFIVHSDGYRQYQLAYATPYMLKQLPRGSRKTLLTLIGHINPHILTLLNSIWYVCNFLFIKDRNHLALLWICELLYRIHAVNCLKDTFTYLWSSCHVVLQPFCMLVGDLHDISKVSQLLLSSVHLCHEYLLVTYTIIENTRMILYSNICNIFKFI